MHIPIDLSADHALAAYFLLLIEGGEQELPETQTEVSLPNQSLALGVRGRPAHDTNAASAVKSAWDLFTVIPPLAYHGGRLQKQYIH